MRVSISPHHHQHLLLSLVFIVAILVDVMWKLIMVSICICVKADKVKQFFFMCILALHVSFSEEYLLSSFALLT